MRHQVFSVQKAIALLVAFAYTPHFQRDLNMQASMRYLDVHVREVAKLFK